MSRGVGLSGPDSGIGVEGIFLGCLVTCAPPPPTDLMRALSVVLRADGV